MCMLTVCLHATLCHELGRPSSLQQNGILALAGSGRTCGLESRQAQNSAQASEGLSPARLIIEGTRCLECAQSSADCTVMSLKNIPVRDINKDSELKPGF